MEAESGVHPAAMGGTPLAADEAQGNLDFFPDLAVASPSYSLMAQYSFSALTFFSPGVHSCSIAW